MKIILRGDLPAKKNRVRPKRGSRGYYDGTTGEVIKDLANQAAVAWRGKEGRFPPVEHPDLVFRLYLVNPKNDRDGIITTALDALVKGGVLVDDSVEWLNGAQFIFPAEYVERIRDERIEIDVLPPGTVKMREG